MTPCITVLSLWKAVMRGFELLQDLRVREASEATGEEVHLLRRHGAEDHLGHDPAADHHGNLAVPDHQGSASHLKKKKDEFIGELLLEGSDLKVNSQEPTEFPLRNKMGAKGRFVTGNVTMYRESRRRARTSLPLTFPRPEKKLPP